MIIVIALLIFLLITLGYAYVKVEIELEKPLYKLIIYADVSHDNIIIYRIKDDPNSRKKLCNNFRYDGTRDYIALNDANFNSLDKAKEFIKDELLNKIISTETTIDVSTITLK